MTPEVAVISEGGHPSEVTGAVSIGDPPTLPPAAAASILTTQTLPATETYTVKVDPSGTAIGSMNVNVTSP